MIVDAHRIKPTRMTLGSLKKERKKNRNSSWSGNITLSQHTAWHLHLLTSAHRSLSPIIHVSNGSFCSIKHPTYFFFLTHDNHKLKDKILRTTFLNRWFYLFILTLCIHILPYFHNFKTVHARWIQPTRRDILLPCLFFQYSPKTLWYFKALL